MRAWLKVLSVNFLIVIIVLFIVEVAFQILNINSSARVEFHKKVSSFSKSDEIFLQKKEYFPHSKVFQPTPYLGVTYNSQLEERNQFGVYSIPLKKSDECFIGVLGGSVAERLTHYIINNSKKYEPLIKGKLSKCLDKKIVWVNLSGGTFKQPYQYIALSFFSEVLDIAINVDGYNEVMLDPGLNFPEHFPYFTGELYYSNRTRANDISMAKNLSYWSLWFIQFSKSNDFFIKSALYSSVVLQIVQFLENRIEQIRKRIREEDSGGRGEVLWQRERVKGRVNVWKKFTLLQANVAQHLNIPMLFILQPNIHFIESKELSPEESQWVEKFRFEKKYQSANESYSLLTEEAKSIKNRGILISDRTMIFKNISDSTYSDSCCHLNDRGQQVLADALINELLTHFSDK